MLIPVRFQLLFAISLLGLMSGAFAAIEAKSFDCPITEKYTDDKGKSHEKTIHAKFALSGLSNPRNVEYEFLDAESAENFSPVVVEPQNIYKESWSAVTRLNDNYSVRPKYPSKQVTDKRTGRKIWVEVKKNGPNAIELFGDGDGVDYAFLVLYKDSGFQKGYFKFKADDKKDDWYQKIHCEVEDVKLPDFSEQE